MGVGAPVPAAVPGEFVVYLLEDTGMMKRGSRVNLFHVRGLDYVRAYGNAKSEDDLGVLPEQ